MAEARPAAGTAPAGVGPWRLGPVLLIAAGLLLGGRPAAAQDLLLVPYLGFTFAGSSALLGDLEQGSSESASVLGASAALLGGGWLGVEGDIGWVPGYFQRGDRQIVAGSFVSSFTGAAVVTLPVSITRESLRPYVVAGGGLLRAEARDALRVFNIRSTMPAVTLGGGAIGFLTNTVGVRFDLRHIRSLGRGSDELVGKGPRVRFWRGSVGLVLRY